MTRVERLELSGVPLLLRAPSDPEVPAPLIVLWHGFGPPASEEALADLLPLEDVRAWKAYLGLPLFGHRLPNGGPEAVLRLQLEDFVLKLLLPVVEGAVRELPDVVAALEQRCPIDHDAGIGLFGFSAGAIAALLALAEDAVPISAAVLAGAPRDLNAAVENFECAMQQALPALREHFPWVREEQVRYAWSPASETARERLDFVDRAAEIAGGDDPLRAILIVHGEQDEMFAVSQAADLHAALSRYLGPAGGADRLELRTLPHLAHHIDIAAVDTPEQRRDVDSLRAEITGWFNSHLTSRPGASSDRG